ncbi:prephenate dehydrogenase [Parasporobacterium paucivorans DSM 15970]|uniref:Prephenate dehydrogenase n=2 Tax=Parasporobacterium TaxID=115543 RepID=A0A1M6BZD4_9FIRM|nr:prephenate dehydrogenase [Parasporobacterium paucivorans DSM 15970]
MIIGLVGLGLIGGSYAKAIKKYTDHTVYGFNRSVGVIRQAQEAGVIDGVLDDGNIGNCDMVIISIYPTDAIEFILSHASRFKKGAVITDACGTKRRICSEVEKASMDNGFYFIGGHPMAGIEKSGFEASFPEMFGDASLILTPYQWTPQEAVDVTADLARELGFGKVKISNPQEHDEMISYTSQLPHVLSCAFIGSELAEKFDGFSAGSFQDMARVAKLNEVMWSELFIENREYLCREIDGMLERLSQLSTQIRLADREKLRESLRKSRETKERIDGK